MAGLQNLIKELRRRRVFRAAGIYMVGAWVAIQVASLILPALDIPDSAIRYVWLATILLFPLVIIFAWFFEISSAGLERTPPVGSGVDVDLSLRRLDFLIIGAMAIVGSAVAWQITGNIRDVSLNPRIEMVDDDLDPFSIAVLPLANLSGDPEQQFFVSGMQDALISGLSRIRGLRVTSKTSTLRYRDTLESLPVIASQLGVAKLIEGSVFRVGNQVRISIQLIDATEDRHIWSDIFEEDIKDVLRLQSEVARAIADEVEVAVSDNAEAAFEVVKTVNPAAYEAFLKGQFHVERFTPQDMMAAAQYYQQALELDPDYALAHFGLSKLCAFQAQAGVISPEQARASCWPHIQKTLELDSSLAEAHMAYAGHMTWQRFDWVEGARGFERAIELNPSYAEAHMFYSHFLSLMGRTEEGISHMQKALELDPFNPFVRGLYGAQLMMIDEYQQSVDVIEEVMSTTPGFGFGHNTNWICYHQLGERDKAIASAAKFFRLTSNDPTGALALEDAYANGDYEAALLHAARVLEKRAETTYVAPSIISTLFEQGNDIESAITWSEISYEMRDPEAPYMAVRNKAASLRSHPRFIKLLREMGHDYWADKFSKM
jgi:TolB-like protein/Tfp pilus assembly protein PilF